MGGVLGFSSQVLLTLDSDEFHDRQEPLTLADVIQLIGVLRIVSGKWGRFRESIGEEWEVWEVSNPNKVLILSSLVFVQSAYHLLWGSGSALPPSSSSSPFPSTSSSSLSSAFSPLDDRSLRAHCAIVTSKLLAEVGGGG